MAPRSARSARWLASIQRWCTTSLARRPRFSLLLLTFQSLLAPCCRAFFDNDIEHAGEQIVRFFLAMWEDPTSRRRLLAIVKSAVRYEAAATMLREFVSSRGRPHVCSRPRNAGRRFARNVGRLATDRDGDGALHRQAAAPGDGVDRSDRGCLCADDPALRQWAARRHRGGLFARCRFAGRLVDDTRRGRAGWRRSRSCTACCTSTGMNWVTCACSYRAASSNTAACTSFGLVRSAYFRVSWSATRSSCLSRTSPRSSWPAGVWAAICTNPLVARGVPVLVARAKAASLMLPDPPVDRTPPGPLVHLNFTFAPGDSPQRRQLT